MRVLFVTSEVAGLFKLGGLGDVSYALPLALSKLKVHISVVMPYYEKIKLPHVKCVGQLAVDFDRRRELIFVFRSTLPESEVPVYLFRHPSFNVYRSKEMLENFAFFDKAVTHFFLYSNDLIGGPYDIIHCQDWHTALVPMLLGEQKKFGKPLPTFESVKSKTIFTIHNHLYKGETGVMTILKLGLPKSLFHTYKTKKGDAIKMMREALEYADVITTVSKTYAHELITTQHGDEINEVMKRRADNVVGILNGIDQHLWNPATDKSISVNYNKRNVISAKAENKDYLRKTLKLPDYKLPLFGFVGRLEFKQKGLDLIINALKVIPPNLFQLVLLGTGSASQQDKLKKIVSHHENVRYIDTFDERLARRIYAASDVILVPSKFEPCGLIQMIAMRYGALPLARKTGGLADTVIDHKTGFIFEKYRASQLITAMQEAITLYHANQIKWREMVIQAMAADFSWDQSAKRYLELYRKLAGK